MLDCWSCDIVMCSEIHDGFYFQQSWSRYIVFGESEATSVKFFFSSSVFCFSCCSLFPVLPRRLRHLWIVRQTLGPHVDVVLQCSAHLAHHAQLPHWGWESVHSAAPALDSWCSAVPARPLRLEQVRFPVRHRPRWDSNYQHTGLKLVKTKPWSQTQLLIFILCCESQLSIKFAHL